MNRKVIILILVVACLLVVGLGSTLVYLIVNRAASVQGTATENMKPRVQINLDIYAGRDAEAIDIVKNTRVISPEYIDAYMAHKKDPKQPMPELTTVTIESLVEKQLLEERFNMKFLKKGEWRALHLDTEAETGLKQKPDPQYEVYLDYQDEAITVGPVWIVDLESKDVIARNDMARIFTRNIYNCDEIEDALKKPENVIHAITSHKFQSGIDLGGVFLLHFLKLTTQPGHADDEIIGWTVMQEFEDDFSAYFQWKEKNETRVAKFAFNWATKSLAPKGLLAIDLMATGENMQSVKEVDIYPTEYNNNLNIPRTERWTKNHACRNRDYREICTAFVKVLEEQEFINAIEWLLTNGEPDARRRVDRCKEDRKCRWITKQAASDINPENKSELIEIDYKYELNMREHSIRFLVDSEKETITPLDKISQWAYWSVTPRS